MEERDLSQVPNIPAHVNTPCRNEDVSGNRLPNGNVIDLWIGDSGSTRATDRVATYNEAAALCLTVCKVQHPEAFAECDRARIARGGDEYAVMAGVLPHSMK